jgi:ATP-dependent Clp protease ATP-binding subunit ClpA
MFERFTTAARTVVVQAYAETKNLHQAPVGTQHLLLALVADDTGPIALALHDHGVDEVYVRDAIIRLAGSRAPDPDPSPAADAEDAAALKAIGIDLDQVRRAVEENFGPGALRLPRDAGPKRRGLLRRFYSSGRTPFSPRAKKVLELSLREAILLEHHSIAPEHLMLGILRERQGLAAQLLAEADVDVAKVRADLIRALNEKAAR